jgi:hypothetical protein
MKVKTNRGYLKPVLYLKTTKAPTPFGFVPPTPGMEPRVSQMLGKRSAADLQPVCYE